MTAVWGKIVRDTSGIPEPVIQVLTTEYWGEPAAPRSRSQGVKVAAWLLAEAEAVRGERHPAAGVGLDDDRASGMKVTGSRGGKPATVGLCQCWRSGASKPRGCQRVEGDALFCGAHGQAAVDLFGHADLELAGVVPVGDRDGWLFA